VSISRYASGGEQVMRWLELLAALMLVILFAIGVYDLGLQMYKLLATGSYTDPNAVISVIDTVLLLLIIVEVFQTVVASSRGEPVVQIVINAALIAIARKVISYRPSEFPTLEDAFVASSAYAVLLVVLLAAFWIVRQDGPNPLTR